MKKIVFIMVALFIQLFAYNATYAIQSSSDLIDGTYTYVVSNEKAIITGTTKDISGKVVIPDKIGGYPVIEIDSCAFLNKTYMTEVIIPEGVEFIDFSAFYGSGIVRVSIPSSVKSIGSSAFGSCNRLNSVYITDIEAWCNIDFENAYANPFSCDVSLYLNKQLTTSITIPESIKTIKKYSFYMAYVRTLNMPDSVEIIEDQAFYSCRNMTSITLSKNIKSIGKQAFYNCGLYKIDLPESLETIGQEAFGECVFGEICIPNKVKLIPRDAFYNCLNLSKIVFLGEINTIEGSAFANCSKLKKVFYAGSEEQFKDISISYGNNYFTNARIMYNCPKQNNYDAVLLVNSCNYYNGSTEYDICIVPRNVFSGMLIVALYSDNNTLIDIKTKDVTATSTLAGAINDITINDSIVTTKKPVKYKIFLWNSLDTLKPLCHAYEGNI